MKYKIIIFDFDGTLIDTRLNIVRTYQAVQRELGWPVTSDEHCASTIGLVLNDSIAVVCPGISDEKKIEAMALYNRLFEINREVYKPTLFPGVKQTLQAIKEQGAVITIASARGRESLVSLVEAMGLTGILDFVLAGNDVVRCKPDPEPVNTTLAKLGFTAADALVVGDMPYDILMGLNADTQTVGVTYGNATREELLGCGAHAVIDSFPDLLSLL